jgi:glucosyl-3-phosphoglycerate synthase
MKARGSILANTYHHSEYQDKRRLVELKQKQGVKVSLAFPTLNEAATIGKEVLVLKTELMDRFPLLDEIAVIDSGSTDDTRAVAERFGAAVYSSSEILRTCGTFRGKGENLWKSLYALSGDIIVWVDADISNIAPKFVYGLVGPLLEHPHLDYVKAFYERPLRGTAGLAASSGGRVTEILVRPLFSLLYPELAELVQPLSGEYAGRRSLLETLPFSVGYGVETGHLVDILHARGARCIGQVDLDLRVHRNQSLPSLSRMSFGILRTLFSRLERYGEVERLKTLNSSHISLEVLDSRHSAVASEISAEERPPIIEIKEYRKKFRRWESP